MSIESLRRDVDAIQHTALAAVDPVLGVRRHVSREHDRLIVDGLSFVLPDYDRVFIVAAGKAAVPMTLATAEHLGDSLTCGVVVTKYGHGQTMDDQYSHHIDLFEAGHPVPDENSVRGAQAVADLARGATERDLVICLVSGGGSALLTLPVSGLSLDELQQLTDGLLRSGATINEMNTVRKHWSQIKGGNLARLAHPATVLTLILSDVVGDPLEVIASGPTVPDPTTVEDARAILARYGLDRGSGVFDHGANERSVQRAWDFVETPKPGDEVFERVHHVLIGSNRLAAAATAAEAHQLGYNTLLLSTYVEGEAREVARVAAGLAKGVRVHGDPISPPACLIWGGETTVTVRGKGRGGRNQELALAAALALDGWPEVLLMALATDGTDGPTDAAGAIATGETVAQARTLGLDPLAALDSNDSYTFFDTLGDLIRTGPTGTNVNDLLFLLVGERAA